MKRLNYKKLIICGVVTITTTLVLFLSAGAAEAGTVRGHVYDPITHESIVGATVTLKPHAYGYGTHDYTTTTDESGNYEVANVITHVQSSGGYITWIRYTVSASKENHNNGPGNPTEIAFSETVSDITCNIPLQYMWWGWGTISGYVRNSVTQEPLAGVSITIKPYAYGYGLHDYTTTTNANGYYKFTGVQRYTQSSGGTVFWTSYKAYISGSGIPAGYAGYVSGWLTFSKYVHDIGHNIALTPIVPPPVADFSASPTGGPLPLTVQFTDESTGVITSWFWSFGDGAESTEQNPVHTYTTLGQHNAYLEISGPGGMSSNYSSINCEISTIEGIVFRTNTAGEPIPNIEVEVWQMTYPGISYDLFATTTTDQNGFYKFDNLPAVFHHNALQPNYYKIKIVQQLGYEGFETGPMQFYDSSEGWLDGIITLNIPLTPSLYGTVSGCVYGGYEPLAGATVTIKPHTYGYGSHDYTTTTDENGDYEFTDVLRYITSSGGSKWLRYTVYVSKEGYEDFVSAEEELKFSPTVYDIEYDVTLMPECDDIRLDTERPKTANSLSPQVASDESGHVYAAWYDERDWRGGIRYNYSHDYGMSWQDLDIRLDIIDDEPGAASLSTGKPKIACDGEGNVHVVWSKTTSTYYGGYANVYIQHSSDYGVNWLEEEIKLSTTGGSYGVYNKKPQISIDNQGYVYVIWQAGYYIYFRKSADRGLTWEPFIRLNSYIGGTPVDPYTSDRPQICSDNDGNVYVAIEKMYDSSGGRYLYVFASSDHGETWGEPKMLGADAKLSEIRMACDDKGGVYVVWKDERNGVHGGFDEYKYDTYLNRSSDYGETWLEEDIPIDDEAWANSNEAQVKCDSNGNVYVTWRHSTFEGTHHMDVFGDIYLKRSHDYGATWSEEEIIDNCSAWDVHYHTLDADDSGNLFVTFVSGMSAFLNYSFDSGATWLESALRISDPVRGFIYEPDMTVDASGHIYTLWRQNRGYIVPDLGLYSIYFRSIAIDLPPRFSPPLTDKETYIGRYVMFPVSATDANGDEIQYGVEDLPEGARFIKMSQWAHRYYKRQYSDLAYPFYLFYWRPRGNQVGEYKVTFWAEDLDEAGEPKSRTSEEITITVKRPPNRPPRIYYLRNYRNRLIYWRGYDREDRYRLEYSYKIDSGEWSEWSRRSYLYLYHLARNLDRGWHTLQIKARDKEGLESPVRVTQFFVR